MAETEYSLTVFVWVLAGAGWGLANYKLNNHETGEPIDYRHLGTTVLEFGAAGFIMAMVGDEFTIENLEYYALVAGPVIDNTVNTFVDTRSKPVNRDASPKETDRRDKETPDEFGSKMAEEEKEEEEEWIRSGP